MSQGSDRDLQLLRQMLTIKSAGWHRPRDINRLPASLRRHLIQADAATLERLLLETAQRLHASATVPTPSRADLHNAIQTELQLFRRHRAASHPSR